MWSSRSHVKQHLFCRTSSKAWVSHHAIYSNQRHEPERCSSSGPPLKAPAPTASKQDGLNSASARLRCCTCLLRWTAREEGRGNEESGGKIVFSLSMWGCKVSTCHLLFWTLCCHMLLDTGGIKEILSYLPKRILLRYVTVGKKYHLKKILYSWYLGLNSQLTRLWQWIACIY